MIAPAPSPPPVDFAAVKARRRAAAVAALRTPGARLVLRTIAGRTLGLVVFAPTGRHERTPRPVASATVAELLDAGRLRRVEDAEDGSPAYALDLPPGWEEEARRERERERCRAQYAARRQAELFG